jgi:long-chain acyl-CoA synthetase
VQDRWYDATGVELRQGYGLTEAAPVCLFNRVDLRNRRGTLGVPFPGVRVEIRDPATCVPLPAGTPGEIWVSGENVGAGYVRGGEAGCATPTAGSLRATAARSTPTARSPSAASSSRCFTRNGFNVYPRRDRARRGRDARRPRCARASDPGRHARSTTSPSTSTAR